MTYKKCFLYSIVGMVFALIVMGLIVYIWDPYNYYRIEDGKLKYVASAYIDAGVIRNADYDTAIIGSSMSQNFDPQLFRDLLNENVVKVNTGGISLEQRDLFYNAIEDTAKANKYYIEVAVSTFNLPDDDLSDTPVFLYDDTKWNDFKYLYGYETWLRGMPISVAYKILDVLNIEIDTMHNLKSVDNIGDWHYRHTYGKEVVKGKYLSGEDAISEQNLENMYGRMIQKADSKLKGIIEEDNEYVFFFPPYSALFWYNGEYEGYGEEWYKVKAYIIEQLLQYPNVKIYDFQYADFIDDLDLYRDSTHYKREINDWMVECFNKSKYQVTKENYMDGIFKLQEKVDWFSEENVSWLKP